MFCYSCFLHPLQIDFLDNTLNQRRSNEVANFYTLFVFEDLECPNEISKFLFKLSYLIKAS